MGTKMEPSYANLLVGFIVHQFFSQINGPQTWTLRSLNWRLYRRYLLYQRGANSNYNSCQLPSPKIYLGNFRHLFDFSRYQSFNWRKRPILQTYGLYRLTSSLVVFIFTSIIHQEFCSFSRFLRLRCLCSDGSDFSDSSEAMYQFFDKRGYPVSVVKVGHQHAQQIDRQSALQTAQKEDASQLHGEICHSKNRFKLLQHDSETGLIFSQLLLISFKREKDNFLVRSSLQTNDEPVTFKCGRARYKTCPFIHYVEKTSRLGVPLRLLITSRAPLPMSSIA